jgi:hypothetical protein
MPRIRQSGIAFSLLLLSACGGGGGSTPPPPPPNPDFTLNTSSASVTLVPGGASQTIQVSIIPTGGFDSSVTVSVNGLAPSESASPSSFSLSPGQQQSVMFSASSGATVGSTSVSIVGTSGSLSHTAKLNVSVEVQSGVNSPTRTTFVRDDSLTTSILINNDPFPPHFGVYDPVHQNFFVTNTLLNRVEVYSASTEQLVASISVPQPVAMDITVAGDKVYVGTFTDYLEVIDTSKLEVVQKIPSESILAGTAFNPLWPLVLSDGRVLVLTGFGVDGSLLNLILDPITGAGQALSFPPGFAIAHIARSGDHTKVLMSFNSSGGGGTTMALYDAPTSSLSILSSSTVISTFNFAGNQDGSRWYVMLSNGILGVVDDQLNLITQSSAGPPAVNQILLSRDGQTVLVDGDDLQEYDATSLAYKGEASDFTIDGATFFMLDIDQTGLVFGIHDHGVAFADSATTLHNNALPFVELGINFTNLSPDNGPVNTPTTIQTTLLGGINSDLSQPSVFFGSAQATGVNLNAATLRLAATTPASPFPGPVNFISLQQSGNMTLIPSGFSFGPTIAYPTTNASVAQGGGPAEIFTFGAGTSAGSIQISTGGSTAVPSSIQQGFLVSPYPFLNLQKLPFIVPAGTAGFHDLTVTSSSGSTTNANGFRYYSALRQFPLANAQLQQGVYDTTRKQIYFSDADQIAVFSPVQGTWLSPITLPPASTSRSLIGIALSPDATVLAVSDIANGSIVVLNPDQPGSANVFAVQTASDKATNAEPTSLIALTSSIYFYIGGSLRQLNPGTGAVTTIFGTNSTEPHDRLVRTEDGSLVVANFEGLMVVVDTSTNAVTFPFGTNANDTADLAVSADGTHFVEDDIFLDSNPNVSGAVAYLDAEIQDVSASFGQKFLSSGSLLLQPLANQVDVIDSNTGRLRHRVSLPITISNAFDATVLDEPDNSLFLITAGGIAQLPLDQLPMGFGSVTPGQAATGGGATIEIKGNGFASGAQLGVDGQSVAVTFVDQNTLQFVAPSHSAGGAQISITNPDGERVSVDDALQYSATTPAATARTSSFGIKKATVPLPVSPTGPLCRLARAGEILRNSCEAPNSR